jgi:hypothetical protein
MMTEELVKGSRPLAIEIEYADEPDGFVDKQADQGENRHSSKKDQIMALFQSGLTDIAQIARHVAARPSYIGQVLQAAGFIAGYCDLYTTTGREQNVYSRFFRDVLSFRTVEAASESVREDRPTLQLLRASRRSRRSASGDGIGADRQEPSALERETETVRDL